MSDVMGSCYPSISGQVSGRVVIRSYLYPPVMQTVAPAINQQMGSGVANARYTNRFDDVGYYYT